MPTAAGVLERSLSPSSREEGLINFAVVLEREVGPSAANFHLVDRRTVEKLASQPEKQSSLQMQSLSRLNMPVEIPGGLQITTRESPSVFSFDYSELQQSDESVTEDLNEILDGRTVRDEVSAFSELTPSALKRLI